jgi:hypothetical protein
LLLHYLLYKKLYLSQFAPFQPFLNRNIRTLWWHCLRFHRTMSSYSYCITQVHVTMIIFIFFFLFLNFLKLKEFDNNNFCIFFFFIFFSTYMALHDTRMDHQMSLYRLHLLKTSFLCLLFSFLKTKTL